MLRRVFMTAGLVLGFLTTAATAQACPNPGAAQQSFTATSGQLYSAFRQPVAAAGDTSLRGCNLGPFSGYVSPAAQYALNFQNVDGYALEIRVEGGCDTVMLVNGPDGRWLWDDDSAGALNPLLRIGAATSGRYMVWVGTVSSGSCPVELSFETFR